MFKRFIVTNIRHFSHKHSPSIFPSNLDMQTRIKSLESIVSSQSKTIDCLQKKCQVSFKQGFAIGMVTPITIICLIKIL